MRVARPRHVVGLVLVAVVLALTAASVWASPTPGGRVTGAEVPAQATVTPGHIVVRGRIFYIDRNSDRSHPATGLKVEVWDKDERGFGTGELLATTHTDTQGFFESEEILNIDPDGPTNEREGTQDVFLKLYTDNGVIKVHDSAGGRSFSWPSYQIDERDGLLDNVPDGVVGMPPLYVMESTRNVEALWTYVSLVEGWLFLQAHGVEDPGPVTAYWSPTSGDGPRYDPETRAIYLRDADAGYADVVVQHEAYALLHNLYGALPEAWSACTAGPVDGLKEPGEAACAFVQALATFYPLAVYEHTEFESFSLRGIDFDKQTPTSAGWSGGDTVVGRIAGALWDLYEADGTEEQYDRFNATFGDIWSVVQDRHPTTFAEWWQGWVAMGKDACGAIGSLYQNAIDYNRPPTVSTIPDLELPEDTSASLDLRDYVQDVECDDDGLALALTGAGDPDAGVSMHPTGVISVTPKANWFGTTTVRATVSDGPSTVPFGFDVVVHSVNDCPTIAPRIEQKQVLHEQPIVLDLLRHGRDVEDSPYDLQWYVDLDEDDARDVTIAGQGTTTLEFRLRSEVIDARNVRAVVSVQDIDGCRTDQAVFLSWTARPNRPPIIWFDRLTREYTALKNTDITVDLRGVGDDDEEGPAALQWRVVNELEHAGWGYEDPNSKQILRFRPHPDYLGSQAAHLEVADSTGAVAPVPPATAVITLTWVSREVFENLPPFILKNRLHGKTVGLNADACYDLSDKAEDPDDPQTSLRWFVVGHDPTEVTVTGQGTRFLCLTPSPQRRNYEGCFTNSFVVQDPKNAESEPYDLMTCWRTIRLFAPFVHK